ncbi:MAG: hypothetical protein NC320_01645 [Clostridium sp.]|nr:hypothetical protein [Clostridium sp.]
MTNKIITLETLQAFQQETKGYIDRQDGIAIKGAKYADNVLSFYRTEDMTGDPDISLNFPEEMFLDQAKTKLVSNFTWSDTLYPGSTDPSLEGKSVLILAVKGDTSVEYSFISLDTLISIYVGTDTNTATTTVDNNKISTVVKISKVEGNILESNEDGLYAKAVADLTYATEDEIAALWE